MFVLLKFWVIWDCGALLWVIVDYFGWGGALFWVIGWLFGLFSFRVWVLVGSMLVLLVALGL